MRHVRLRVVEDDTGELGLALAGVDITDDFYADHDGVLLAHDLLEHQNGPSRIGEVGDELEALGAMMFTRGWTGQFGRTWSLYCPEDALAYDVSRMFCEGAYAMGGFGADVPNTKASYGDESLEEIVAAARKHIRAECEYQLEEDYAQDMEEYLAGAMHFLRVGYRKARRRFGDPNSAHRQFWAVADALRHVDREIEGREYRLSYGKGEAYVSEIYEDEYY